MRSAPICSRPTISSREDEVMNAQTLPKVKMPNHDNFIIKFPDRI